MDTRIDRSEKGANKNLMELEKTVNELRNSLEFSQRELDELKIKCQELETEKTALKKRVDDLETQASKNGDNISYLSDQSRRNNIRITGLADTPGETWEQTTENVVLPFLKETLAMPAVTDDSIERCHRIGKCGSNGSKSRHMLHS